MVDLVLARDHADPWLVATMSDDGSNPRIRGGATLQLWRPSDLVTGPARRRVAELDAISIGPPTTEPSSGSLSLTMLGSGSKRLRAHAEHGLGIRSGALHFGADDPIATPIPIPSSVPFPIARTKAGGSRGIDASDEEDDNEDDDEDDDDDGEKDSEDEDFMSEARVHARNYKDRHTNGRGHGRGHQVNQGVHGVLRRYQERCKAMISDVPEGVVQAMRAAGLEPDQGDALSSSSLSHSSSSSMSVTSGSADSGGDTRALKKRKKVPTA